VYNALLFKVLLAVPIPLQYLRIIRGQKKEKEIERRFDRRVSQNGLIHLDVIGNEGEFIAGHRVVAMPIIGKRLCDTVRLVTLFGDIHE
jgi:hypothetical protein